MKITWDICQDTGDQFGTLGKVKCGVWQQKEKGLFIVFWRHGEIGKCLRRAGHVLGRVNSTEMIVQSKTNQKIYIDGVK